MLSQVFSSSVPSFFFLSVCCFLCRTSANTSSISWHVGDKVKSAATILIKSTDNKVPRQRDFDESLISVRTFCMQPLSSKQMTEVKIIVYYSRWCLMITVLSTRPAESLASARVLDFVNSTFCTLFNHCKLIATESRVRFVLKQRWWNSHIHFTCDSFFLQLQGLWWIEFFHGFWFYSPTVSLPQYFLLQTFPVIWSAVVFYVGMEAGC